MRGSHIVYAFTSNNDYRFPIDAGGIVIVLRYPTRFFQLEIQSIYPGEEVSRI